jgi:hypothetical protein
MRAPCIERQLRLRAGMPKNRRNARTAPPALAHPRPEPPASRSAVAAGAAVELTVTVAVPLVVAPPSVTLELPLEQVGRLVAQVGDEVSAQRRKRAVENRPLEECPRRFECVPCVSLIYPGPCATETFAVPMPCVLLD